MEKILEKIKSSAYWRVNIRPMKFEKFKIGSFIEVRDIIKSCIVELRYWDYPHHDEREIFNGDDWIQLSCDYKQFIEYWRFYQSVQFLHLFALREDHNPKAREFGQRVIFRPSIEPKGYVSILSTLFSITEIYEFTIRLAQKDIFDSNIYISIGLFGVEDYQLFFWDQGRILHGSYISRINEIKMESKMGVEELIAKGHNEAIEKTLYVFERFNWINPPKKC